MNKRNIIALLIGIAFSKNVIGIEMEERMKKREPSNITSNVIVQSIAVDPFSLPEHYYMASFKLTNESDVLGSFNEQEFVSFPGGLRSYNIIPPFIISFMPNGAYVVKQEKDGAHTPICQASDIALIYKIHHKIEPLSIEDTVTNVFDALLSKPRTGNPDYKMIFKIMPIEGEISIAGGGRLKIKTKLNIRFEQLGSISKN